MFSDFLINSHDPDEFIKPCQPGSIKNRWFNPVLKAKKPVTSSPVSEPIFYSTGQVNPGFNTLQKFIYYNLMQTNGAHQNYYVIVG